LNDKEETEARAALRRFNFGRLTEVAAVFTRFIKSSEGNSVSYFNIFPMLPKLMANLRSLGANKHAETLIKVASKRFSQTTDLNRMVAWLLMPAVGRRHYGSVAKADAFDPSMETM
jgi:hypothetical protein